MPRFVVIQLGLTIKGRTQEIENFIFKIHGLKKKTFEKKDSAVPLEDHLPEQPGGTRPPKEQRGWTW